MFTSVTGSAPNREFHIEWRTGYFGRPGTANFEVRLYESSTDINVVYGATVDNGSEETSGIQSSSAGPATQFSCGEHILTNGLEVTYSCAGGGTPTPTPTCTPGGTPGPWSQATPYPIPNVRYGWAQTATHFYVFGGVSDGTRVNNVYRMDIATGAWQPRAPMPFTSEAPTCALMESTGLVYCTEGDTGSGFASYNIATDTWAPLAAIPGGDHYGSASGAFNGKVFVAGGTTGHCQHGPGIRRSDQYVVGRDGSARRLPACRLPAGGSIPLRSGRLRPEWACCDELGSAQGPAA